MVLDIGMSELVSNEVAGSPEQCSVYPVVKEYTDVVSKNPAIGLPPD
ncbi:hypothetical protein PC129_g7775 [Phytophthora cactorum]|uniref:Uncharacterized protein n=1 Tax=Phytophthora cactorum TaxID=29920 RepID=A0A329T390_9STRA|nr:hypothetical protein Pcac1_g11378 [Phytophthora cactorum]KAG2824953.1 hypothetical protein PC112_g9894 [Phytophthora cactorum]KAG2827773.1 hypothetical protein PC111_g8437 [Phytophthora cactorum]KAG2857873.1 hypothetical protein PC113_g10298 [Phytophthora cactorum]KAG2908186.1 hypothetical protein PC114_g10562 [Phytophthora cactorum]